MRRTTSTFVAAIAVAVLTPVLGVVAPAAAADNAPLDHAVAIELEAELDALAQGTGSRSISDVTIDVSPELIAAVGSDDASEVAGYIVAEVKRRASDRRLPSSNPAVEKTQPLQKQSGVTATRKTARYTADQTTVLPAFGMAWVNQDMTVTFSGTKISSVKLHGASYGTGVALFAYSHIRTTISYTKSQTCLLTRMKGAFSAVINGSAISFAASVVAADGPRGGRMVNLNTNNC
jgi:hypothetical protein